MSREAFGTPSMAWLAGHEFRLAWRDWQGMVTAGNRRRLPAAIAVMVLVAGLLHIPTYYMIGDFTERASLTDTGTLFTVSLILVLYASLLLSQALETVTRSLYSRGDLDLVLSSPVPSRRIFAIRIGANAVLIAGIALLLSAPFIDVLVYTGGAKWLSAFAVAAAIGCTAGALAVAITIGLFRLIGPRRTRTVAQVLAAIIGAAFAIGIQVIAIFYYGTMNRTVLLASPELIASLPAATNPMWLPARAVLGDPSAIAMIVGTAFLVAGLVVATLSPRLGEHALAATDLSIVRRRRRRARAFLSHTASAALRRKEWQLLRRDPWLVSQTLTQLLYLIPPALLLAHNFSSTAGVISIVVMVLVSVAGQLSGALAWLAVSGEDAPDLIVTAPVTRNAVTRAKVEAVLGAVAIVLAPLVLALMLLSPRFAAITAVGALIAAASTIRIQLWFRAQARRSNFRRRHTSSRIATFGEALVSFSWATAAGLSALEIWPGAIGSAISALIILAAIRAVSPRRAIA